MTSPYQPRRKHRRGLILLAVGGGALAVAVVASALGSGNSPTATPAGSPAAHSSAPAAPPATETPAPPDTAPADVPSDTTAPAMTPAQQQAVQSAQGYLEDGQGFSEKGLIDQLTSSYGEGFAKADAEFAVTYLHPDWNAQAVESAQGYLDSGEGFSRAGLIDQLTSAYGEQFTHAQAVYAVDKVGL